MATKLVERQCLARSEPGFPKGLDDAGRRVGLGYLELTGYGQPLRL